jgi:membrane-associated phospholipid phosphatase
MDSSNPQNDSSPPSPATISQVAISAIAGFAATVLLGKLSLIDAVKRVDEAVFDACVGFLQSIPGLTSVSERLTDIGAIPVNVGMALGLAFFVCLQRRNVVVPGLVLGTFIGSHALQNLTNRLVDGHPPTDRVIGAAGPYFSGGVMRVIVLTGMAATLALPRSFDRWVWRLAVFLGVIEAITRLALGRHWPIDLVASFPIGLGIVWLFRQVTLPQIRD